MNKKTLTGLLSVLCVLLCALVLLCACGGDNPPAETEAPEVTTEAPATVTDPETDPETDPATNAPETDPTTEGDALLTYTIIVVDKDGNPIEGVDVQMCAADGTCYLPVKTGANGAAAFQKEAGEYYVTIPACPEGFVTNSETKYTFEGTATELTITLEKASVPTEEPTEEPTEAPTEPETKDPLREEYDIEANEASVEFSAAGYPGKVFQLFNYDNHILLGDLDLSKYESMIVVYGSDGGAMLGDVGSEMLLTANGAIYDNNKTPVEGAEVLASAPLSNPTAAWYAGDREVVINIDSDYNGPVYLCHKMGGSDGVAVSAIILVKKQTPIVYVANDAITIVTPGLQVIENVYPAGGYDEWNKTFTIKVGETGGYWDMGWIAINTDVYEFGYLFGGASPLNNGAYFFPGPAYTVPATPEQIAAAQDMGATTAAAFLCACAEAALGVGENTVQVVVKLNGDDNQIYVLREYTVILEA